MKIGLFINPCQNLFQNGCFQQSYFIFKALKTANSNIRLFSTGNSSFDNSDASFNLIGTPVTLINDINDVVDLDLMLFVSGVLYQEDFLLQMMQHVQCIQLGLLPMSCPRISSFTLKIRVQVTIAFS